MTRLFTTAMAAFLLLSVLPNEASAQRCGSRFGGACVTCCQGTGRSLSTCQAYCSSGRSEKKSAAQGDGKRSACLREAGISRSEASSVSRRDPRHATYHACMGR